MKLLYLVESGESKFLVFDEMPDKISTKYGDDTIIGRIGGIFYDFLAKRNGRREAFGGRKFDIILDNGKVEKCEGQWWDAVTDRAKEELEKEGNPFSKMMLIGVSSVDRLLDCYVYCGLWASESKIKEMIAEYKGRIYEYYEFKEEVIDRINETIRKSYIQSWKEQIIRSGMRQKRKDVFESPDGLYIIYKDGHAEPFTGDNSKDCVRYIGLKHRYMSFAISLTEHDIIQLLDDDSREESGSGTYYERECDALFDIDGRGNTERLVTRNPKLRNLLEDGEYIPSLGQLNLMAHYMDELNKAFTYVSASPLSSTWYWSSTESSQAVAWYVVFSSGLTGTGNKHIGDMVRAVIDF